MSNEPRCVSVSCRAYRLLLWLYPPAFRRDFGPAMAQLFRDAALDAHRRGGWAALPPLWLAALADLGRSAVREHHDALGRWGWVRRRVAPRLAGACCVALAVASLGLLAASHRDSIGLFGLAPGTSVRFANGAVDVRHVHAYGVAPAVPEREWHDTALRCGWVRPSEPDFASFACSSGHVLGVAGADGTVTPAEYGLCRVPLWAVAGLLAACGSSLLRGTGVFP